MRILIGFGSTDGHTRDLANFAAAMHRDQGHEVFTIPASGMAKHLNLIGWDAAIIAALLHRGRYQMMSSASCRAIARRSRACRCLHLGFAVCGGSRLRRLGGLRRCVTTLQEEAGWTPDALHHAAGALRFSRFGLLKRLVLKVIARQ